MDDVETSTGPWEFFATYQPTFVVIGHDMTVVYRQQGHNDTAIRNAIDSAIETMQMETGVTDDKPIAGTWKLYPAYPNPFNPQTTISYRLPDQNDVSLKIYDIHGGLVQTLVSGQQQPGFHQIQWDGTNHNGLRVASGLYFYALSTKDFWQMKKVVLVR